MTDTPQTQATAGSRSAARAAEQRARDADLVDQARAGDPRSFGRLFDRWLDPVYDRILHRGFAPRDAGAIEAQVFTTVYEDLPFDPRVGVPFAVTVLRTARRQVAATGSPSTTPVSGPSVEDRLSRSTNPTTLAADPRVAALCWEAADVLGERVRELLDLHYRHGLSVDEVAMVLDDDGAAVRDLLAKLPVGYGHALRARILWRGGRPEHEALAADLRDHGTFDADAVRIINRHVKECAVCRGRALTALAPIEVFAHLPLAGAVTGLKEEIADVAAGAGVALVGSAFLKPGATDQPPDAEPVGPAVGLVTARLIAAPGGPAPEEPAAATDIVGAPGPLTVADVTAPEPEVVSTTGDAATGETATGLTPPGVTAAASLAAAGVVLTPVGAAPPPPPPPGTEAPVVETTDPGDVRRGAERRTKLLVAAAAAAAFVVLAVVVLAGLSSKQSSTDQVATEESTTTTAFRSSSTTSTTAATTTSTAPITDPTEAVAAPSTTVAGGGGGGFGSAPPPAPPTPPTIPLETSLSFNVSPAFVPVGSSAPVLTWSVTANKPVTVVVSGEGVSSGSMSGSVPLCPGGGGPCASPGPHYYSIVVSEGGQVVRQTTYPLSVS